MYFAGIGTVISLIALREFAAATPLRPETTYTAGGPAQVGEIPTVISAGATRQLQLAHFLENLKFQFFNASLGNLTYWNTTGYSPDLVEVVNKTTAVSRIRNTPGAT